MQLVREANPNSRIILITGHRDEFEEAIQNLIADGADAVCYKPFEMSQLLDTVRQFTPTSEE